jgi:nucleotide-binding universal stress UspA family protein
MAKRVLAGTDGSTVAQAALRWAARSIAKTGGELVVVSAWRPPFSELDPATYDEQLEDARRTLHEQWCEPAKETGVEYRSVVVDGDPRTVLLARAEEEDAELVVVGARGAHHHRHPLHIGSVAHHLVHHSDRPVVLIPPLARASVPSRIVVGADGSDDSAGAVAWCADYARALDAEVVVVYAELPIAEWVPHSDPRSWYRNAQRDVEEYAAPVRDAGVNHRTVVVEHEPVTGLIEAAMQEDADLVVVGARGRGKVSGVRLGSTALHLLHQSGIPVAVVPPPGT